MSLPSAAGPATRFAWQGDIARGVLALQHADGREERFESLAALVPAVRDRFDPGGLIVPMACAWGAVLHAVQAARRAAAPAAALAESRGLLAEASAAPLLTRLSACLEAHRALLADLPLTARLLLEAQRIQREAQARLAQQAQALGAVLPPGGGVLLAWPAGPCSDLGRGSLTAAVLARAGAAAPVWVAGPPALAADACRLLRAHGVTAEAVGDAEGLGLLRQRRARALLLRTQGEPPHAEAGACALAEAARAHGIPVHALASPRPPAASAVPLPSALAGACIWHPASSS